MLLLGIDLETGASFDAPLAENFITEFGFVLWEWKKGPIMIESHLLNLGKPVSKEAEQYTGISDEFIKKWGTTDLTKLKEAFAFCLERADYIVAHNGNAFDRPLVCSLLGETDKVWIDTMTDVNYPENCKSRNLTYLQCFHGFAYPGHRAVFDIMAMFRVLENYNIEEIVEYAKSPEVTIQAILPPPANWKNEADVAEFNKRKDKVKGAGFRFNPDSKTWTLTTRQIKLDNTDFGFQYRIIG